MKKELCIIQGNCQVDSLVELLCHNKEFNNRFSLRKYINFLNKSIPDEELAACTVFIYQELGEKWKENSSENVLKRLNPSAKVLKLPNLLFKGYWPFSSSQSPSDFGDTFLDQLIAMKLNKSEIMHIYLYSDLEKKFDLKGMFQASLEIERQKEVGCIVQTVDWVLERFQANQIFYTINHPCLGLLGLVAEKVFYELDFPLAHDFKVPNLYPEVTIPVHPQLAKIHGLKFAGENTQYNVLGKMKTCAQYTSNYIDSQLLDLKPLTGYLQIV